MSKISPTIFKNKDNMKTLMYGLGGVATSGVASITLDNAQEIIEIVVQITILVVTLIKLLKRKKNGM